MQRLTNEQYLDTEDFWKDYFDVKFIKKNKNDTEVWKVTNKEMGCFSLCNSMLMAFKIAHTACERLEGYDISIDHSSVLNKACVVLGKNSLYSRQIMSYQRFFNERWHEVENEKRPIYIPGEGREEFIKEVRKDREVFVCNCCTKAFFSNTDNIHECEICTEHICSKCLKMLYGYSLRQILSDGVVCRECCEFNSI